MQRGAEPRRHPQAAGGAAITVQFRPLGAQRTLACVEPLARGYGATLGGLLQGPRSWDVSGGAAQPAPEIRVVGIAELARAAGGPCADRLLLAIGPAAAGGAGAALEAIAQRLIEPLAVLLPTADARPTGPPAEPAEPRWPDPILQRPVADLELGVRSANCLRDAGIAVLGELIARTEAQLLGLPHLGRRCLREIQEALAARGLRLGG